MPRGRCSRPPRCVRSTRWTAPAKKAVAVLVTAAVTFLLTSTATTATATATATSEDAITTLESTAAAKRHVDTQYGNTRSSSSAASSRRRIMTERRVGPTAAATDNKDGAAAAAAVDVHVDVAVIDGQRRHLGDVTSNVGTGLWYTFFHKSESGSGATGFVVGCSPTAPGPTADDACPGTPGVTLSTDVNTPPWTISRTSCTKVTWTETWYQDNQFQLYVNGLPTLIGSTPGNGPNCGENPNVCYSGGKASSGTYVLPPGHQSITFKIVDTSSTDRGAFKLDDYPCPAGNVNSVIDSGNWFLFKTDYIGQTFPSQQNDPSSPWTFYSPCPVDFTVAEVFISNNQWKVYDFGVRVGTTNVAAQDRCTDGYIDPDTGCLCEGDFDVCIANGAAHGTFQLPAGSHSITIEGYPSLIDYGGFKITSLCGPPTKAPTRAPTKSPTKAPVTVVPLPGPPISAPPVSPPPTLPKPTKTPTKRPTLAPVKPPTRSPTRAPTRAPSKFPTKRPTLFPTRPPTKFPTRAPTKRPTLAPVKPPTRAPTRNPTRAPTKPPTKPPSKSPTRAPTKRPTRFPTRPPTKFPTIPPAKSPTGAPLKPPTRSPTRSPTKAPAKSPTESPSNLATLPPTKLPTNSPVKPPTKKPTIACPARGDNVKFELWDGDTDSKVSRIRESQKYCLSGNWNIRAVTPLESSDCGAVRITLFGPDMTNPLRQSTDSVPPFFLYGDNSSTGDVYGNTNVNPSRGGLVLKNGTNYCVRARTLSASSYSQRCFKYECKKK